MINLLPEERREAFKRTYFMRLLTVFLIAVTVVMVIHSVLLIPSYVFLEARILDQTTEKEFLGKNLEASGSSEVENRIKELSQSINLLETLKDAPSFVATTNSILAVSRTGIVLTQISYDPTKKEGQVELRGTAADREALRGFVARLEAREGTGSVTFPIGNLSRDKDLPFTISITLLP